MHMHTREQATIVFKRNGRYDPEGLKKLNYILRDWRKNQPINMDPHLFDLIWEVYQKSGSHVPIHVVCGYRSPDTNNMLRQRTRGVAKHSQHMLGKAMDFYIPDVPLAKLREIGFKMQMGGVGFYPTSGSPFVHMDTGNVRSWPRMSREQLVRLFPDGKTMHIPADGKPLPGYAEALASYQARKAGQGSIVMASASGGSGGKSFLARLFGGGGGGADEEEDTADTGATSVKVADNAAVTKAAARTAPASDDDDEGAGTAPAVAATAPIPTPKATPAADVSQDETVVAMAPLPRPSPSERRDTAADQADDQAADNAADATEVAMAPLPRPSPMPRADNDESVAVADAVPAPLSKPSFVAQPSVALASASATGGTSSRSPLPEQLAYQAAATAVAARAAPHQPMTAAEAIAEAVGQGNQAAAPAALAYAPADDNTARIDTRTGAIVAGLPARGQTKAKASASNGAWSSEGWQSPVARFTTVAFDSDAMALIIDPESPASGAEDVMQLPRPMPDAAVFVGTKHSSKYGFGRLASARTLRNDRQPASDTLIFASNGN